MSDASSSIICDYLGNPCDLLTGERYEPTAKEESERAALPAPTTRPRVVSDRPCWDDYFMGLAFDASQRSPDLSTQHGCLIVHKPSHRILGTGYNGYAPGDDDEYWANVKPKRYDLIKHSERNAVDNCWADPRSIPDLVAYVTGQCCGNCAEYLAQHNVLEWFMADRRGFSKVDPADVAKFERVVADFGVTIHRIKPRLDWKVSHTYLEDLRSHGFITSAS